MSAGSFAPLNLEKRISARQERLKMPHRPNRISRSIGRAIATGLFFLSISMNCEAACTFMTRATIIAFGNYDVSSTADRTTTATFTVRCTNGTQGMGIELGPSSNGGGYNPRLMKHATLNDTLQYNLYQDAGFATIWGDRVFGFGSIVAMIPAPNQYNGTIFARLPAGQDVTPGMYRDTILINVLL